MRDDHQKQMGKVIAKAWSDPAFKHKLLANPAATLRAEGIDVPDGLDVRVVENTVSAVHIVLPPKPTRPLTDAELDRVAGGGDPTLVAYGAQDFYLTGAAGTVAVSPWNNSSIEPDFKADPITGNQICETTVSNSAPIVKIRR